ncbi:MAG TPA: hypothetical protein VGL08_15150 [Paraburkholderia sp.]|jgi:hypothetical protein
MKRRGKPGVVGAVGAALLAFTQGVWAGAPAQPVSADDAPQAWLSYAQLVSQSLQTALATDTEVAQRFNDFFGNWVNTDAGLFPQSQLPADGEPLPFEPPTLKVRVWLDRAGHVERVEFDQVGSDEAEADLRSLLLAQSVGEAPPRRMKQPVVVRLSLGAAL